MGNCAYFLNIPRKKPLDEILKDFLEILSGVNCVVPDGAVNFFKGTYDDYYIVCVSGEINVYVTAEEFNRQIDGEDWVQSVWIEDIYDCSALVLEIAREYLKFYPEDLFVCESNDHYFTKKDIDKICRGDFGEDWYYAYK